MDERPDPADELGYELQIATDALAEVRKAHQSVHSSGTRPCSNRYNKPAPCAICEARFDDPYAEFHAQLRIVTLEEE